MLYTSDVMQTDLKELAETEYIPWEKLRKSTVRVTGAGGMLAYYAVCILMYLNEKNDADIHVIALVRSREKAQEKFAGFLQDARFTLLCQDVCDEIQAAGSVDYIIHAAGAASPHFIKKDPLGIIRANTEGTLRVMELARQKRVKSVLYTSTREVYGKVEGKEWIGEGDMGILDPLDARSCYPESKRMAEQILRSCHEMFATPFQVVRIAHSYGPGMGIENDGRVMSDFVSDAVHGRNIVLKSSGMAKRAFCYVTDAVAAMFLAMLAEEQNQAYNVANESEAYPIREVAQILTELMPGRGLCLEYEQGADQSGYCQYERVGLDTAKLRRMGWRPQVALREGLGRTLRSFGCEGDEEAERCIT